MAGHSHWAGIKHHKKRQDQKRSNLFSKLSQKISQAAQKNPNPELNPDLKQAIEEAKQANVPKDNIKKAIARAKDSQSKGQVEIYEAVVSGGVGLIIKVRTDNKNRTLNKLRQVLEKYQANLGKSRWMFDNNLKPKYPLQIGKEKKQNIKQLIRQLKELPSVKQVISNLNL